MHHIRNGPRGGRRARRQAGQNLVEFALVLPVLMLLMLGGYNLGLVWLRISDAAYIAQSAATMAARYGGETPELRAAIQQQVRNSFLHADAANFSWRVETHTAEGELLCGGPGPLPDGGPGPGPQCKCNWGEQITVITSYRWSLSALVFTWTDTYESPKSALCWRGTANGGG